MKDINAFCLLTCLLLKAQQQQEGSMIRATGSRRNADKKLVRLLDELMMSSEPRTQSHVHSRTLAGPCMSGSTLAQPHNP